MCGICGEVRTRGEVSLASLSAMTKSMRARGPDAAGVFAQSGLAFGHRRLSILDLAPASQQPMIDNELGLGIVFNGCIYNFRELRAELQGKGYRFFSDGDTEVILKAYHAWGADCVKRFKGMFAFALWERDSRPRRAGARPARHQAALLHRSLWLHSFCLDPAGAARGRRHRHRRSIRSRCIITSAFHGAVPPPRTVLNGVKKLAASHSS